MAQAERNRLINKSLYFAFFSKTTFLYQLSMTTNGIVKYCTQHTVPPQCTSSQLRLHRRVFLHFLSSLIRHTNTLRLNSISVWCKHCVRHLSHKQRYIFCSSEQKGEESMRQRPFDLSNYPKVNTMFDTSTHVLHFLYCPDTLNSLQQ